MGMGNARKTSTIFLGVVVALLSGNLSKAQAPQPVQQTTPRQVSLPHLYYFFFMWQNHLDHAAAAHEKNGKDGAWLSTYLQRKLGFTPEQFAPVRGSAQRLAVKTAALDAKAKVIIQSDRALYAKGQLALGDKPPGLPQLKELTQEREKAIADEITSLNAALGPENAAKLKEFLQSHVSTQAKALPFKPELHPPMPQSPTSQSGVQQ